MIEKGAVSSESVSHHTLTTVNFFMDGLFVISLIDVLTKHAKLLKPLLERGGRVAGHMYDRQKCSEGVIPHSNNI